MVARSPEGLLGMGGGGLGGEKGPAVRPGVGRGEPTRGAALLTRGPPAPGEVVEPPGPGPVDVTGRRPPGVPDPSTRVVEPACGTPTNTGAAGGVGFDGDDG